MAPARATRRRAAAATRASALLWQPRAAELAAASLPALRVLCHGVDAAGFVRLADPLARSEHLFARVHLATLARERAGEDGTQVLARLAQDDEALVCWYALDALRHRPDAAATAALTAAATAPQPLLRSLAAAGLTARHAGAPTCPSLVLAADPDPLVRLGAAQGLAGGGHAAPHVRALLHDAEPQVRRAAAQALARRVPPAAAAPDLVLADTAHAYALAWCMRAGRAAAVLAAARRHFTRPARGSMAGVLLRCGIGSQQARARQARYDCQLLDDPRALARAREQGPVALRRLQELVADRTLAARPRDAVATAMAEAARYGGLADAEAAWLLGWLAQARPRATALALRDARLPLPGAAAAVVALCCSSDAEARAMGYRLLADNAWPAGAFLLPRAAADPAAHVRGWGAELLRAEDGAAARAALRLLGGDADPRVCEPAQRKSLEWIWQQPGPAARPGAT